MAERSISKPCACGADAAIIQFYDDAEDAERIIVVALRDEDEDYHETAIGTAKARCDGCGRVWLQTVAVINLTEHGEQSRVPD